MFTGIIEHVGTVRGRRPTADSVRLQIDLGPLAADAKIGDSIAVDGACLTIAEMTGPQVAAFDAVAETIRRTTLGQLAVGEEVNLERALAAGSRVGGHFVQGHVDGIGTIRALGRSGGQWTLTVAAGLQVAPLLVEKGSIAVAGISLTIASIPSADQFTCAIIPTTLQQTTLRRRRAGDRVNLEADLLGKYVHRFLASTTAPAPGPTAAELTEAKLKEHGFA
jgi:riboflavin synthase